MRNKYTANLFMALSESDRIYNVFSLSELGCNVKIYGRWEEQDALLSVTFLMGEYGISHNNETTWVEPDDLEDYFINV